MTRKKKSKLWYIYLPFFVFILLSLGIFLGYFIRILEEKNTNYSNQGSNFANTPIVQKKDRVEEIINLIQSEYLYPIPSDSLYTWAIQSIFEKMDPYSQYITAEELHTVSDNLTGNSKGFGVQFSIVADTVLFTNIVANSPADEAKLKAGDLLIKVNENIVSGIGLNNDKLIEIINSEADEDITFEILRLPQREKMHFTFSKGNVPLTSIDAYYMLNENTGYIKINRFSAATYREFLMAMQDLKEQGLESLILDLRQNPGGYVDAAIAIADEFLDDQKLVITTENAIVGKEHYYTELEGSFEEGPLAILIDEGTASASEVLAATIQDWDRGWIIGRRSYGKGLIQQLFELRDGSSIRLTIMRYTSPSGRDLQRPKIYDSASQKTIDIIYSDEVSGTKEKAIIDTNYSYTKILNRKIASGGGVKPDIIVPFSNRPAYLNALYNVLISDELNKTVYKYYINNYAAVAKYKSVQEFTKHFRLPDSVLDDLLKEYNKNTLGLTINSWPSKEGREFTRKEMTRILAAIHFGSNGESYYENIQDAIILKAMETLKRYPKVRNLNN